MMTITDMSKPGYSFVTHGLFQCRTSVPLLNVFWEGQDTATESGREAERWIPSLGGGMQLMQGWGGVWKQGSAHSIWTPERPSEGALCTVSLIYRPSVLDSQVPLTTLV